MTGRPARALSLLTSLVGHGWERLAPLRLWLDIPQLHLWLDKL